MKLMIAAGLLALGMVSACAQDEMTTLSLPKKNPTSYEFGLSKKDLRNQVLEALTVEHQIDRPIFGPTTFSDTLNEPAVFHVSDSANALWGKEILTRPENVDDLYLQDFHNAFWASPVYQVKRVGLPFVAEFHLHFSDAGQSRVRLSVTAYRTEVRNGATFAIRHNGPGMVARYVAVSPTTIEEYVLLRYLGEFVGMKDMPEVSLPPRMLEQH